MSDMAPCLVLASESPRRQQLLREAGYQFAVRASNIDELASSALMPIDLARQLSLEKASAVASEFPDQFVLGADTVVAFGDKPLGKPADAEDARRMLTLLSGTTHIVITGVSLICLSKDFQQTRHAMSAVKMRRLKKEEIEQYIASMQWEGKAGGYGIQDQDPFVTNMAGSHSNIVGLPMELTSKMLAEAGIFPASP